MILQRIASYAGCNPEPVVISGDRRLTFSQLLELAARLAGEIPTGAHLGVVSRKPLEYVVGLLAALWAGGVAVPVTPGLMERLRAADYFRHCDVSVVLSDLPDVSTLPFAVLRLPEEARLSRLTWAPEAADLPALILRTSGTTADPKAAVLSERALAVNALASADRLGLTPSDRGLMILPLTYSFGLSVTLSLMMAGASVVLPTRALFMPGEFIRQIRLHGVTVTAMVASHMYALLSHGGSEQPDWPLRTVLHAGGSTPSEWVGRLARSWPGTRFVQGYGLTEAGPRIAMQDCGLPGRPNDGSGLPLAGVDVQIATPGGLTSEPHVEGEIWARTPCRMIGYYRNDEATARTFEGAWLKTGDLGYLDDAGALHVRGRLKSLIKVGGRSVYPEEVEEILLKHAAVSSARVYSLPDEREGEIIAADLVTDEADLQAVQDHCRHWLEPFQVPKVFRCVSAIPKSEHGKILRRDRLPEVDAV